MKILFLKMSVCFALCGMFLFSCEKNGQNSSRDLKDHSPYQEAPNCPEKDAGEKNMPPLPPKKPSSPNRSCHY